MLTDTDAEQLIFVDAGIMHFDGKGNLKATDVKVIQFNPDKLLPGDIPIQAGLRSSCTGVYNVKPDKSYDTKFKCMAQNGDGVILTLGVFINEGHIGKETNVLTSHEISGNIQQFTVSLGDAILQSNERICTTSGTFIKK